MPFMSFLRPLPLPRLQTLQCLQRSVCPFQLQSPTFHGPLSTVRNSATAFSNKRGKQVFKGKSTVVSRASRNRPQKPPRVNLPACKFPSNPPPTPDPSKIVKLPYHIHRTPSQQLPVYKLAKRGGNLRQTRLRKVEGDIARLRTDLQEALSLEDEHIKINHLTKHIIIKACTLGDITLDPRILIMRAGMETIRRSKVPDRSSILNNLYEYLPWILYSSAIVTACSFDLFFDLSSSAPVPGFSSEALDLE